MEHLRGNSLLDRSFQLSITLKGLDGLLQIIGAFLFLTANAARVNALVDILTLHLLSPSTVAFLALHLIRASQSIAGHTPYFLFVFLLSHGVAKAVLVTALWFNRMWAYPAMILMLAAFILYQIYVMVYSPTIFMALLTIFDAVVIWLTNEEYKKQKRLKAADAVIVA